MGIGTVELAALAVARLVFVAMVARRATHGAGTSATALDTHRARTPPDRTIARSTNPEAWKALGVARFDAQAYPAAVAAFERATALAPGRADLWSALGEARVLASPRDPMPRPALAAFRRAVALDPHDPRGRYFLAVERDLSGDHLGAIDSWLALLADTPPGSPWTTKVRRTIVQVGKINAIDVTARLAAIDSAALRAAQQGTMAQTTVAGPQARLKTNPLLMDGWAMQYAAA